MSLTRYSFRVIIQQEKPDDGREFGPKDAWAAAIKDKLDRYVMTADIIEVSPIRNKVEKKQQN